MNDTLKKLKKLALPIAIGVFAMIMVLIGLLYYMETQTQSNLRSNIATSQLLLNRPFTIPQELIDDYDEALQYIPVVPANNQQVSADFLETVIGLILEHANSEVYDGIIITPPDAGYNIEIDIVSTRPQSVKIDAGTYYVYSFIIDLTGVEYEEMMQFIVNLSAVEELKTLVVQNLSYQESNEKTTITAGVFTRAS